MTDQDLTQIGIEAFGARRRLQQAIAGQKQRFANKIMKELCFVLDFRSFDVSFQPILIFMKIVSSNTTASDLFFHDDANHWTSYHSSLFFFCLCLFNRWTHLFSCRYMIENILARETNKSCIYTSIEITNFKFSLKKRAKRVDNFVRLVFLDSPSDRDRWSILPHEISRQNRRSQFEFHRTCRFEKNFSFWL